MLAIAGGKGGSGKTTTTLGLAGALARRGFDPLVVDADCDMPDVGHRLEIDDSGGGIEALARGDTVHGASVTADALPGVSVVTGGRRDALETALCRVTDWHGPVIVDCPAGLDATAVRPFRHADSTLFVSTDDPQCLDDTDKTRSVATRLGSVPVGVLVRSTPTRLSGSLPTDWTVLGRTPYVERPLENEHLGRKYISLSEIVFPGNRQTVGGGHRNLEQRVTHE